MKTREILDRDADAVAIGDLYRLGGSSFIEAIKLRLECGRLLAVKKAEMAHGEWLPWMAKNEAALGFLGKALQGR